MQNLRRNLPPLSSLLPFEAASRHASITKAANELGLTQAAISKQIKALEDDLGVTLFDRRNRAVFLTDAGREFGLLISEMLGGIAQKANHLRQSYAPHELVLRSQLCEGLYWLMPRLSRFYLEHPDISVRVTVSQNPLANAEERYDLALQTTGRDIGSAQLVFTASDAVFPVCSPDYLEKIGPGAVIDRLADYQLLHHQVYPQDWMDWDTWLKRVGTRHKIGRKGVLYDSYHLMIEATVAGLGIGLGWSRTVENYLNNGTLVRPFNHELSFVDGLSIYKPKSGDLSSDVRKLANWLRAELT
jgi:LysR family glycine cleavage system transcriptional activator